jgi:hypothetical protein
MVPPHESVSGVSLIQVTTGFASQLSVQVTEPTLGAGTSPTHSTVIGPGGVQVGACVSSTVIVCVHSLKLPQKSVQRYVLVMVPPQESVSGVSLTQVTTGLGSQLSAQLTEPMLGAGTSSTH